MSFRATIYRGLLILLFEIKDQWDDGCIKTIHEGISNFLFEIRERIARAHEKEMGYPKYAICCPRCGNSEAGRIIPCDKCGFGKRQIAR